mmetsp:Transcript_10764/g.15750  ORF Transcript_10764/g.15750 Transcript_10764/m.15750 type:complete len:118 (-) Transcript_10764:243-596(-)
MAIHGLKNISKLHSKMKERKLITKTIYATPKQRYLGLYYYRHIYKTLKQIPHDLEQEKYLKKLRKEYKKAKRRNTKTPKLINQNIDRARTEYTKLITRIEQYKANITFNQEKQQQQF